MKRLIVLLMVSALTACTAPTPVGFATACEALCIESGLTLAGVSVTTGVGAAPTATCVCAIAAQ